MSSSEILHEVIPSDLCITLVGLVRREPTACGTLKLEGSEGDVVDRSDGVGTEVFLDLCDPVICLQRVSSLGEPGGADRKELLQCGVLWSIIPLGTLVLQHLKDRSYALSHCGYSLPKDRVLWRRHVRSWHPVYRNTYENMIESLK